MEELTGCVSRILFRSEDSDFTIVLTDDKQKVVGEFEQGHIIQGVSYKFTGTWAEHKRFGKQFKARHSEIIKPHSREGMVSYLIHMCDGIGTVTGHSLWDQFGSEAVTSLMNDPAGCSRAIPTLAPEVAEAAARKLKNDRRFQDTKIKLRGLLSGRGFHKNVYEDAIELWGTSAPDVIARDPFKLMVNRIHSCGFKRCDALYCELGLPLQRLKRQVLCLWDFCSNPLTGSTWTPASEAHKHLLKSIGGVEPSTTKAIALGVRSGWLAIKGSWLSTAKMAEEEQAIADKVRWLNESDR